MKLKTSVAAVILAFSATGAWAGPTGTAQSKDDLGGPDSAAVQSSTGAVNEELEWKFVNGTGAPGSGNNGTDPASQTEQQNGGNQAAQSGGQGSTDQSAMTEGQGESDQAAASEQESGDQAATADEQAEETAKSQAGDDNGQSAMTEDDEESGDQAATAEDDSSDQMANSEEESEDQSAQSEEQNESDRSANSDQPAADLKDKVVVIIPKDWKGSLPDLITALESSPDARDIVIVRQGDPQAISDDPDDSYSASRKPAINQQ